MTAEDKIVAHIDQAQQYLRGKEIAFEEIIECAVALYEARKFNYARRLFARLRKLYTLDERMLSKWAISTCKDDDQPGETRFDEAIEILANRFGADPSKIKSSRIAGNLGSIYKQKWRFDNQESWLKTALCFLNHGYERWLEEWLKESAGIKSGMTKELPPDSNFFDQGYCAINAAYVCDTLAARLREISKEDPTLKAVSDELHQRSKVIRNHIVDYCEGTESFFKIRWEGDNQEHSRSWFYTTWAEALMGLGMDGCTNAVKKIEEVIKNNIFDPMSWSGESASQQIAHWIEEDHFNEEHIEGKQPYRDQARIFLERISGYETFDSRNQRIGLALSGGGFRASLFHIGVLARLAEQDLLRKIEVISCVSGGSIIGAYYYLEVRNLLQTKSDSQIKRCDYIKIVQKIESEFLGAINIDFRGNLFYNIWDNLRMAFDPGYSRTSRLADLYEKHLYAKLLDKEAEAKAAVKSKERDMEVPLKKPEKPEPIDPTIYMEDILIRPMGDHGERLNQSPKWDNWKRNNKLPMLVLNATTLNTGHCWQFTATWMGEPPSYINNETDALPTLRRMYYKEAPPQHRKIRLATAVAASSCVPGLFKPIQLRKLYLPDSGKLIDVELVDGGVYDNQGINTLLEQACTTLIISDASGQLSSVNDPASGPISVGGRTNAILQERIRACQLNDLRARYSSKILKSYLLMHLTKGLPSEVVNWRYCDDPYEPNFRESEQSGNDILTTYGIRKNIQLALASIRTDLDAFHEKEAYTLMYSGYLMTDFEVQYGEGSGKMQNGKRIPDSDFIPEKTPEKELPDDRWTFYRIRKTHEHPFEHEQLQKLLDVAARALKVHVISPVVRWIIRIVGMLALVYTIRRIGISLEWDLVKMVQVVLSGLGVISVLWIVYQIVLRRLRYNPLTAILGFLFVLIMGPLTWLFAKRLNLEYLRVGKFKPAREEHDASQT